MNIIEEVLSACISSARAEPMELKQGDKYRKIHSQLHAMMLMPMGSGKSTIIENLPKKSIVEVLDYTLPALLGTIKKSGEFVPGFITKVGGKTLVVDEFHSASKQSKKALLSLTEQQKASRSLGYNIMGNFSPKRTRFLKMSAKDNKMSIDYCRFSCMLAGIFAPRKRIDDKAFSSRFMHLSLSPTLEECYDISVGNRSFKVRYDPYDEAPVFEDYQKFVNCHYLSVRNLPPKMYAFLQQFPGFALRNILQFSRLFSWASRGNSIVDDWEKYIPFIPFSIYNMVTSTLTHSEYEILCMIQEGKNQHEIAMELNCSDAYVSKVKNHLRGCGLG